MGTVANLYYLMKYRFGDILILLTANEESYKI